MKRNRQKGFTLVEVIVVLVILAILATVMIPSLTGYIDLAGKNACAAERATLRRGVIASYQLTKGITMDELGAELAQNYGVTYDAATGKITGGCPSGGKYTVTIDTANNEFAVTCDTHGTTKSNKETIGENLNTFIALNKLKDYYNRGNSSTPALDSTGGNWGAPVKAELIKQLKLDPDEDFDFRVWHDKGSSEYTIYIFDPISSYKDLTPEELAQTSVDVTKYVVKNNELDSTEEGTATLKKTNTGNGTAYFPILNDSTFTAG